MLLIRTQGRCKVSVRTVFFASLTISLLCFRIWTPTCQKTSYWVFYFILRWGIWIQAFINTQGNLEKGISSAELYLKPITWFRSKQQFLQVGITGGYMSQRKTLEDRWTSTFLLPLWLFNPPRWSQGWQRRSQFDKQTHFTETTLKLILKWL